MYFAKRGSRKVVKNKAVQYPAIGVGATLGCAGGVLDCLARAQDNNRPATRGDLRRMQNGGRIRENDMWACRNCFYALGKGAVECPFSVLGAIGGSLMSFFFEPEHLDEILATEEDNQRAGHP